MLQRELYIPLILLAFFAACTAGNTIHQPNISQSNIESAQEIKELNSKLLIKGSQAPVSPADYLIGPTDLLEIKVYESQDLTSTVRVSSRGQLTLPLLGNVEVDGLTARELEEKIETLLMEGKYLNDPNVSVFIKEHRSKLVSVVGHVRSPGSYELIGKQTLLDVLASAKGLEDKAGRTIYVTRTEDNGSRQSYMVDLEELLVKGDSEINLYLKPGDVIYLPEAGTVFVEGAVRKPGSFSIDEGSTTVSQAIAMAGGPATYADTGQIKLVRHDGSGDRQIFDLSLSKIRSGEIDDPVLEDRDAVIVGASAAKRVLYGLRLNFLLGLVGVGYDPPESYRE